MKIRKAKKDDLDEICVLGLKLLKHHMRFRKYYTPIKDSKKRKKIQKKYFSDEIKKRNSLFLVLVSDGNIVGYSIAKIGKDPNIIAESVRGDLAEIYVDKEHRDQGWGTKLLQESLRWFKSRKIKRLIVKYDVKNKWAEKVYTKAGFRPFQNEYEKYLK
jgi:ribosomal protein S18 acetylase RimI-like enzyme